MERFDSPTTNNDISIKIIPGRIHCLLGKNGTRGSTLMNILFRLLAPNKGGVWLGEGQLRLGDPRRVMAVGIGIVHQHFILIPPFTVAENMVLGHEPSPTGLLGISQAGRRVQELSRQYRLEADPDALVEDLPVGTQQWVKILESSALDARYLIFDESTAVLTPQEIGELVDVMHALRDKGRTVVFITHKLREMLEVADDITTIRRGEVVRRAEPASTEAELATMMVGRSTELKVTKQVPQTGEEHLVIPGLTVASASGAVAVDHLSLTVRGGEIIVAAGIQGSGQSELTEALLDTMTPVGDTITLDGADVTRLSPAKTLGAGLSYVPGDRNKDGLIGGLLIAQNLVLGNLNHFSVGGNLKLGQTNQHAAKLIEEFDIRTDSHVQPTWSLSDDNQQKVMPARELSHPLSLLLANQPTRGVDVGAIEFLHNRIVAERGRGTAALVISMELDEVGFLADRIAVMYWGCIAGVVGPGTPRDALGLMMAEIDHDDAAAITEQEGQT